MASFTLKDTDKGYKALMTKSASLKKRVLEVGITGESGGPTKSGGKGDLTVLDVATFHEFGLGVPERSFIRGWFDVFKPNAESQISAMLKSVVKGTRTLPQVLELLGVRWAAEIQKYIAVGTNLKPLSPITIIRKGSSIPLINTGQLRSSITYRVVGKT